MFNSIRFRLLFVLIIFLGAGAYVYTQGLNLGLDLQGGMHLVLTVDDPEGAFDEEQRADAIEQSETIIRNRVDELGVEEPVIQRVGQDRLIVELAGIDDEERAREVVGQTAMLQWHLVRPKTHAQETLERIDRAIVDELGADSVRALGRAVEAAPGEVEQRLFEAEEEEDPPEQEPQEEPEDPEEVEDEDLRPLTGMLMDVDREGVFWVAQEDYQIAREFLDIEAVQQVIPRDLLLRWGWQPEGFDGQIYRQLFVLNAEEFITGERLQDANSARDQQTNQPIVQFELDRAGGRIFGDVTGRHIGDQIAVLLDNEVVTAPVVRSQIRQRGQIELGAATDMQEARDLALVLRAGALPAPLHIIEERSVGPSLGQASIDQGRTAGIIGLLLVIGMIIAYYRATGVLAVLALSVYVALMLGGLAMLNATLTLPGIAGIILSIGMAVDANVLIFERIREELDEGRPVRTAVDEGFGHAISAIVDANLTTLITALILFQVGTGPVRGFAVTLSIGIIASFFTALYVTRTFYLLYLSGKKAQDTISI